MYFIECSGIAEPVSVLDACLTPILAPFTTITHMIGVVDASMYKHIKSFPKRHQGLFYEQLAYCSVLFVNKIDSADVETTSKLLKDLEVINQRPIYKLVCMAASLCQYQLAK